MAQQKEMTNFSTPFKPSTTSKSSSTSNGKNIILSNSGFAFTPNHLNNSDLTSSSLFERRKIPKMTVEIPEKGDDGQADVFRKHYENIASEINNLLNNSPHNSGEPSIEDDNPFTDPSSFNG